MPTREEELPQAERLVLKFLVLKSFYQGGSQGEGRSQGEVRKDTAGLFLGGVG